MRAQLPRKRARGSKARSAQRWTRQQLQPRPASPSFSSSACMTVVASGARQRRGGAGAVCCLLHDGLFALGPCTLRNDCEFNQQCHAAPLSPMPGSARAAGGAARGQTASQSVSHSERVIKGKKVNQNQQIKSQYIVQQACSAVQAFVRLLGAVSLAEQRPALACSGCCEHGIVHLAVPPRIASTSALPRT